MPYCLVCEQELGPDFCLSIVKLRRLLFDRICYGALFLQNLVYHFARLRDVRICALDLCRAVSHLVDRLVDYDFGIGLAHDLVYLVPFRPD